MVLEEALESENYRLLVAKTGPEALALARADHPDVIILDVMMPEVTGYDVCRELRQDGLLNQVPILFLTALQDRGSRQLGLEAGADEFLNKPVDLIELKMRLHNITRLNRFRQLSEERERFEAVFAHSPDGIVVLDAGGQVLLANRACAEFGLAPAAPDGATDFYARFTAADQTALRALAEEALRTGQRCGPIDAAWDGAMESGRTVEITAGSLPWSGRRAVQLTLRDITAKKEMESWLTRSQRIELLGQFSSEIVHDVNNLLAVVTFHAALMADKAPAAARVHAVKIEETAMRAAVTLRRILQFARGSDGERQRRQLDAAAAAGTTLIGESLGRDIQLSFQAEAAGLEVTLDENQLHQVIMNLCVNARDAMDGRGRIEVTVARADVRPEMVARLGRGARAGSFGVVRVRDFGTGMTDAVKARLFDPFFTTKAPGKGTGLGLAAVLRILSSHQGFVSVDSTLGVGTCFTCHFPLAE